MPTIEERCGKFRARVMIKGEIFSKTFPTRHEAERWANNKHEERVLKSHADQLLSLVPRPILEAIEATKYTKYEILRGAIPVGILSGIYFLIKDDEVTYVGQTRNIFHRLAQHSRNGMEFDGYNFIPCEIEKLDEMEQMYLMALWPKHNRRFSA